MKRLLGLFLFLGIACNCFAADVTDYQEARGITVQFNQDAQEAELIMANINNLLYQILVVKVGGVDYTAEQKTAIKTDYIEPFNRLKVLLGVTHPYIVKILAIWGDL